MVADDLDKQGEISLAGDVRYFAKHLPPVLTDRQQLAVDYVLHRNETAKANEQANIEDKERHREMTR